MAWQQTTSETRTEPHSEPHSEPIWELLRPGAVDPESRKRAEVEDEQGDASGGRALVCRVCRRLVAWEGARVDVGGAHRHQFANPNGFVFTIGCFQQAPGAAVTGVPTTEFTWFPGHAWCYLHCRRCGVHLGWHFTSAAGGAFYGLILDRLETASEA